MTSIDSGVETENDSNESSLQISTCSRSPMKNNVNNDELQIQRFNNVETRSRIEFTYPLISVSSFGSSLTNCPEEIETIDTRKRRYLYSSIYTVVKKKEISTLASTSESVLHFASEPLRLSGFERRRPKIFTKAYLHKHLEDIGHVTRVKKRVRITAVKKPLLSPYLESPEIQYRRQNMQLAVVTNNTDWLTFSLDKGMKPDFPIKDEGYAIHAASSRGFTEIVGILLQYGADPNCRDSSGNTPLHLAAGAIKLPVINLLLQARADVKCLNKDGNRPVDLAQRILNLQSHYTYDDSIVNDVQEIIRILTIHSQRQEENRQQLETLSSSYSQLSVSNNSIPDGVRDLMTTINSLNIKI